MFGRLVRRILKSKISISVTACFISIIIYISYHIIKMFILHRMWIAQSDHSLALFSSNYSTAFHECKASQLNLNKATGLYEYNGKPIIWQYWHDHNTPLWVKLLVESLQCKNLQFNIILVHHCTFYCYLPELRTTAPAELLSRLAGHHLTDIFRIHILKKYGGIWVDVDGLPVGSFYPWYRLMLEKRYDIVCVLSALGFIESNPIGPTRANLSLFQIASDDIMVVLSEMTEKLKSNWWLQSYPVAHSTFYLPLDLALKRVIVQDQVRYYAFDGPNTVEQLVHTRAYFEATMPLSALANLFRTLSWTPILYLTYSSISNFGFLTDQTGWSELMEWSEEKGGPSVFAYFVTCALINCQKDYEKLGPSGQTPLTKLDTGKLIMELRNVKPEMCSLLPSLNDDQDVV